jgi:hypothetical protein
MRFVPSATLLLVLSACASREVVYWRPRLVSQVPDSARVRYRVDSNTPFVQGHALDWTRQAPRIVTLRGDTVVVPPRVDLDVRLRQKNGNGPIGGVIGLAVGMVAAHASCPDGRSTCIEDSAKPLVGAVIGWLGGSLLRSYPWVRVRRDTPSQVPSSK